MGHKQINMTIRNVKIGQNFYKGNVICTVVDFIEEKSMVTGQVTGIKCMARANSVSTNVYEIPFATVVRNKIKNTEK